MKKVSAMLRSCLVFVVFWAVLTNADGSLASGQETRLDPAELTLWTSPDFRKRFAESFLSQTDVEPRVSETERQKMLKILDLISADKLDAAEQMLQKETNKTSNAIFDKIISVGFTKTETSPSA